MKTSLFILISAFSFQVNAALWTFHGCKDNWSAVRLRQASWPDPTTHEYFIYWDHTWDLMYPELADSGSTYRDANQNLLSYVQEGYLDTYSLDIPSDYYVFMADVYGPAPDYSGNGNELSSSFAWPGEYWIDFDATGSPRVSMTQPSDFGKWAWDGSVNPSWFEPLAKKGHGKGHK